MKQEVANTSWVRYDILVLDPELTLNIRSSEVRFCLLQISENLVQSNYFLPAWL
jgi:hypothetical protein